MLDSLHPGSARGTSEPAQQQAGLTLDGGWCVQWQRHQPLLLHAQHVLDQPSSDFAAVDCA